MKTETNDKSRRNKWVAIALIVTLVIILGSVLLINFMAEPYLESRLESEFSTFTNQDATLDLSEVDIGLFPVSLVVEGISLSPGDNATDRMKEHPVLKSTIESISVSNISWWKLATSGNITIDEAIITGADFYFNPGLSERFSGSGEEGEESDQSRSIKLQSFSISGSSLNIYNEDLTTVKTEIDGADFSASGLNLSQGDIEMADRFEDLEFEIDSASHFTDNGYYWAEFTQIAFDTESGDFLTEGFTLIPQLSPQELPRQIGHEVDHLDIESGSVRLSGLDVPGWLQDRRINAKSITFENPEIRISRDKNPPDKPKEPRQLFNTKFANLPYSVSLDTLSIKNGFISYREWKENQDSSGTVFFDSVEIQMTDIQNSKPDETIKADASTLFMNESKLTVQFDFSLDDDGAQTITGQMDSLNLELLNPVLAPLAFVRIDDGVIHSLSFNFELNETAASGEFLSLYDDFSMSLLSKDNLEETTGNRIVSFLANNIQIQSSNKEPDPRTGEISYEKEVGQSTVNYWWKSLRSGIKDLVQRI